MSDETIEATSVGKAFVPKALVYDGMGPKARPVSVGWLIPQLLLMLIILFFVVVVFAILGIVVALGLGADLDSLQDPASEAMLPVLLMGMLGVFVGFIVVALVKTKMEGRSLASMGLDGFLYGPRFWSNFIFGIGLAVLLTLPAVFLGVELGMDTDITPDWSLVMTPAFGIGMAVMLAFLLVQAPSEELLFRGWMLSGLTARHGFFFAAIVSSVLFGLFHGDRFAIGAVLGIYYLVATASLGFLFAAISWRTRSVIPASGLHTGYNFTLFAGAIAFMTATSQDGNFLESFLATLDMSELQDLGWTPALLADMALRFAIPVVLGLWFLRSRKGA